MNIYTTSQARNNLFKLVDAAHQTHEPVYIVGKRHKAVLISEEDYRAMLETLHILAVPGLKESIINMHADSLENYCEVIEL